ncbi:hypothetical protein AAW51_4506 [Caldimonas brevitalea]|uniref:Uncharacterized protein n=2 Tax=Caldimonas brevitalea TaxID=413882 RepID=A0A0G3BP63_9BURK|nr:hypothetical protein AAW51_4506 [Caldimonas brevitalea]
MPYRSTLDSLTSKDGFFSDTRRQGRERLVANHAIHYDGFRYEYPGYRYDIVADAIADSRRGSRRPGKDQDQATVFAPDPRRDPPGDAGCVLMASLGIGFEAGRYLFAGSRYDQLVDAVNHARRTARIAPAVHAPGRGG